MGRKIFKVFAWTIIILTFAVFCIFAFLEIKYQNNTAKLEEELSSENIQKIDLGTTSKLKITPLIDWHSKDKDLKTEMGVSYFIETDSASILFDLGFNAEQKEISPLQHNMNELGIQAENADILYITHNHLDHVGGKQFMDNKTFGINPAQKKDLSDLRIYTPVDMTYPNGEPITSKAPLVIAPGVASIGSIPRQLLLGRIDEQSLAVNVEGKGIVLLVGCAHQTIPKILDRTKKLFDTPIYGIVGGLHLPVPQGRFHIAGIDLQLLQSGDGLLDPISREDVDHYFNLLREHELQLISIGGHDSSDEMIQKAKDEFGNKYRELMVGKEIEI